MADRLKGWRVSEEVVRLILLRVLPGKENLVGKLICERCSQNGIAESRFRVYRLFGSFDLLYVQDGCDLQTSDFAGLGTIPHITTTSEYTCYKWNKSVNGKWEKTFDIAKLNDPLIALSFLKISPIHTQQKGINPEIDFADYLHDVDRTTQMLNTLGWVESILIVNNTNLSALFKKIADWFPHITYLQNEYFAEKTLTIIGHTLDVSVSGKKGKIIPLSEKGGKRDFVKVDCSLACKPRSMGQVEDAAIKYLGLKGRPGLRFGSTDLHFQIGSKGIKTINDLREKLDNFKRATAEHLVRSHTSFEYTRPVKLKKAGRSNRLSVLIAISPQEAQRLTASGLDSEMMATAIYRYGNLTQSDLSTDAYSDLFQAVFLLKQQISKESLRSTTNWSRKMAGRLNFLEAAINQRSQNVFLGLEEGPFVAYPARMGLQRVFKGLEAYAILTLRRFGKQWPGFVCIGNLPDRFEHFAEYLVVPPNAITQSTSHWAISHELMHILENLAPEIFSLQHIEKYLPGDRHTSRKYNRVRGDLSVDVKSLLLESMTDVLDYALCCPIDLTGYLKVVWKFLTVHAVEEKQIEDFVFYLYRSFAVICYTEFAPGRRYDTMMNFRETAKILWKHIETIEQIADQQGMRWSTPQTQEKLQAIVYEFLNFLQFMPWIFNRVNQIKKHGKNSKLTHKEWSKILGKLKRGILLDEHDLARPDAISWYLRSEYAPPNKADDRINITWLLSLWDVYQTQKLGPDLSNFIPQK